MLANIPLELRQRAQWIVWRYDTKDDKLTKVPYSVHGGLARVNDPSTWATFEEAAAFLASGMYNGLGFVLTDEDEFCFIDLDMKAGMSEADISRQVSIQEKFDSYSERSPSGQGLHIICKGRVPRGRKRGGVEIYSNLRFMTMTGDVYDNKPIADRQELINVLWGEMAVGTPIYSTTAVDCPQSIDDSEVVKRATNAANGDKFAGLYKGDWQPLYQSQSEADFALIDIIGYWTQNREQIQRVFKASQLGQRDKANRIDYMETMVNRSFDKYLPPPNFDSILHIMNDVITAQQHATHWSGSTAKGNGAIIVNTNATNLTGGMIAPPLERMKPSSNGNGHLSDEPSSVKFPPGLIGEISTFIYQSAPRPVAEIALTAAIGLMAGMCGRAYNTPTGAGLNLYCLLVALSGVGKEGMANGIARLINAVSKLVPGDSKVPSIREFIGPSEFRSDAACIKTLEKYPCLVSIQGEFGLKLKAMHAPHANAHVAGLKAVYLDLYGKSGQGSVYNPIVYSDKQKDTKAIQAPAFSILAETTPSTFFSAVDESMIAHGLLPRFLITEYLGLRVRSNHAHHLAVPSALLMRDLTAVAGYCHDLMNKGRAIVVQYGDQSVFDLADKFDLFCDDKVNHNENETIRDLWNRGHLKALKLASLVSVGLDGFKPLITREAWLWAEDMVRADIERMCKRFEKGEIGSDDNNELKQQTAVIKAMREFITRPWAELSGYKAGEPAMQKYRVVPHSFLVNRLQQQSVFRKERLGASTSINRTLKTMGDAGVIKEVTNRLSDEARQAMSYGGKLYMITDMRYISE